MEDWRNRNVATTGAPIPIVTSKAGRVRAAVSANPDMSVAEIAKLLVMNPSDVRVALRYEPVRRAKSVPK